MAKITALVNEWFKMSREDLADAKALWEIRGIAAKRTVGFLTQQSAEKSIKGFLQYQGKKILKSHDIKKFTEDILSFCPELQELMIDAIELTPYAVEYRYPHATGISLDKEDIDKALHTAEKIYAELTARVSPAGSLV